MKKFKQFFKAKVTKCAMAASGAMMALAGVASAAEGDPVDAVGTVTEALTSGVQSFAGKAAALIGVMIVAAIPLAGALWLARRGFAWFKSMAK